MSKPIDTGYLRSHAKFFRTHQYDPNGASLPNMMGKIADEIDALREQLAKVTAERDRLIERWPDGTFGGVKVEKHWDLWAVTSSDGPMSFSTAIRLSTKAEAVRFAAGLDEGGSR